MYCKFCGSPVERKTMRCTSCGKPVGSLTGGNSFKELLLHESTGETVQKVTQRESKIAETYDCRENLAAKKLGAGVLLPLICSLLCLVSMIVLISVSGSSRRTYDMVRTLDNQLIETNKTIQRIEDIVNGLQEQNEERAQEPQVTTVPQMMLGITKQPTSEDEVPAKETRVAFTCQVRGEKLKFSWKKYSEEKQEWIAITEDDKRFEVETEQIGSSEYKSKLKVIDAGETHEGRYRCDVTDSRGNIIYTSDEVTLAVKKAETNNPPIPGPTQNNGKIIIKRRDLQ